MINRRAFLWKSLPKCWTDSSFWKQRSSWLTWTEHLNKENWIDQNHKYKIFRSRRPKNRQTDCVRVRFRNRRSVKHFLQSVPMLRKPFSLKMSKLWLWFYWVFAVKLKWNEVFPGLSDLLLLLPTRVFQMTHGQCSPKVLAEEDKVVLKWSHWRQSKTVEVGAIGTFTKNMALKRPQVKTSGSPNMCTSILLQKNRCSLKSERQSKGQRKKWR